MRNTLVGALAAPAILGHANAAPIKLKLSTSQANDPKYSNGRVLYDCVVEQVEKSHLQDRIQIQFFPDNQLGQEIDVANSVKLGAVDLMVTGTSIWANLVPAIGLMDLGYLFTSFEQQSKALDAGAAAKMGQLLLAGARTHIAGWGYDLGARCVLSKTAVSEPADLAGKKIRTLPNPVITECLRLMGAAATPMAFGEVYTALQAGVLGGLEQTAATVNASKLYETAKFFSPTEHIFTAFCCFLSDATYNRLPKDVRDPFVEAIGQASVAMRAKSTAANSEAMSLLGNNGVTITKCDRDAFRKRVEPQTAAFVKARPDAKPIVDIIQSTAA